MKQILLTNAPAEILVHNNTCWLPDFTFIKNIKAIHLYEAIIVFPLFLLEKLKAVPAFLMQITVNRNISRKLYLRVKPQNVCPTNALCVFVNACA